MRQHALFFDRGVDQLVHVIDARQRRRSRRHLPRLTGPCEIGQVGDAIRGYPLQSAHAPPCVKNLDMIGDWASILIHFNPAYHTIPVAHRQRAVQIIHFQQLQLKRAFVKYFEYQDPTVDKAPANDHCLDFAHAKPPCDLAVARPAPLPPKCLDLRIEILVLFSVGSEHLRLQHDSRPDNVALKCQDPPRP